MRPHRRCTSPKANPAYHRTSANLRRRQGIGGVVVAATASRSWIVFKTKRRLKRQAKAPRTLASRCKAIPRMHRKSMRRGAPAMTARHALLGLQNAGGGPLLDLFPPRGVRLVERALGFEQLGFRVGFQGSRPSKIPASIHNRQPWQMLGADHAMGGQEAIFDIGQYRVRPVEGTVTRSPAIGAGDVAFMDDTWLFGDAAKPLAAVADDSGAGLDTGEHRRLVSPARKPSATTCKRAWSGRPSSEVSIATIKGVWPRRPRPDPSPVRSPPM